MRDALIAEGIYQQMVEDMEMENTAAANDRALREQQRRAHAATDDAARREHARRVTASISEVSDLD